MINIARENRIDILRQTALLLESENKRLNEKLISTLKELSSLKNGDPEQLQLELKQLQQQIEQLNRRIYGDSSEKRPRGGKERGGSKQTGHGPTEQRELEIKERQHELDEADKICPDCRGDLAPWNGQCEESEEVDVVERRFVIVKHQRQKYRCGCGHIETADGPTKLIPGGRYSISFAVEVAIQKYLDHLPLERQVRMMGREGLKVTSQTLWDQLYALYRILAPLGPELQKYILGKDSIGADETTWRMLDKKGQSDKRKKWYAWAICADHAVFYRICASRSAEAAKEILGDYQGRVITDDYRSYDALKKENGFTHAGCWAHVRRKFIEAETNEPMRAAAVVALIGKLYEYERLAATGPPDDSGQSMLQRRQQIRSDKSRLIIEALRAWSMEKAVLPESSFGKAIAYLKNSFAKLELFVADALIPLDNNATERALRGLVIGRKNHYGSKSKRGTEVAALFYSLLESAKLAGVDPKAYLKAAVEKALNGDTPPMPHQFGI